MAKSTKLTVKEIKETQHGRIVHVGENSFKLIVASLGGRILADADCFFGPNKGELISLNKSRSNLATEIKNRVGLGLLS